jgi:hypothetical protein
VFLRRKQHKGFPCLLISLLKHIFAIHYCKKVTQAQHISISGFGPVCFQACFAARKHVSWHILSSDRIQRIAHVPALMNRLLKSRSLNEMEVSGQLRTLLTLLTLGKLLLAFIG